MLRRCADRVTGSYPSWLNVRIVATAPAKVSAITVG